MPARTSTGIVYTYSQCGILIVLFNVFISLKYNIYIHIHTRYYISISPSRIAEVKRGHASRFFGVNRARWGIGEGDGGRFSVMCTRMGDVIEYIL